MKIVCIGTSDFLAETLTRRMGQEGHDVYLLSDKMLLRKTEDVFWHRFYRIPRKGESFQELLQSIVPDRIIFAGKYYIERCSDDKSEEDILLLSRTLQTAVLLPNVKFILLSSTDVYGSSEENADMLNESDISSDRGIRFVREEHLLKIYKKQYSINAAVLRSSQLYTDQPKEGGCDFLSQSFAAAIANNQAQRRNDIYQPVHVSDFVDAVKKAMDSDKQQIYNVCGSVRISAKRLNALICRHEKIPEQNISWDEKNSIPLADNSKTKEDLGWNDIRNLDDQLLKGEIEYKRTTEKAKQKKKLAIPAGIRQVAENLLIFMLFSALNYFFYSHNIFSKVDWLIVYIILISVGYNTYHSVLAAILASCAYLFMQHLSILEMNNFYSYASSMLTIMEYIFLGLVVSYTITTLKEETYEMRLNLEMLKGEYDDLKAINNENVLIKNEYEERILTSKSGFPKLYSIVSRLMVEEPERILMETMQVISELVRTDAVAVYQGQANTPYLRLVNALNDRAAMDGKTWNLSAYPKIYDAVVRGELYQGELGSDEPAVVIPIVCRDVPEAVILIKTLPYECETLYHINLLKTLALLLRDSMEKALQYEKLSREERYVKDTDVLKPEAFKRRAMLAEEKSQKSLAEYCVVELVFSGTLEEAAEAAGKTLRVTDCMGIDEEGRLFALLSNTAPGNLEHLQKRLSPYGVEIGNTFQWKERWQAC